MFLFSGTFFPLEALPGWIGGLTLVFPRTRLVVLVRSLALGWLGWGLLWNLAYLVGFSLVLFPVAIARMRKRLIV